MKSDHNDVFNIGNPNEITVNELATKIIQLTNSKSKLINKDLPEDDPNKEDLTSTKQKTYLIGSQLFPLKRVLAKTIDWVSSQL